MAVPNGLTFTMRIDATDLKRLMAGQSVAAAGASGAAGPSGPAAVQQQAHQAQQRSLTAKGVAGLWAIEKGISGILRNSSVLNTYQNAMGKVFGAAIDILLIPFTPVLNLLLLGMTKLVVWLAGSGYMEKMYHVMERVAGYLETLAERFGRIFKDIMNGDWKNLFKDMALLIKDGVVAALKDPIGALATGAVAIGGMMMLSRMPVIGKLLSGGIGISRAMLGIGAANSGAAIGNTWLASQAGTGATGPIGTSTATAAMGTGGRLAALGAGGVLSTASLAVGVGIAGGLIARYGLDATGIAPKGSRLNNTATGAAAGAGIGAIVGTPFFGIGAVPGAAIGGAIGGTIGFLASKPKSNPVQQGSAQQQGWSGSVNSNNTVNLTQNNYFGSADAGSSETTATRMADAVQRSVGYQMATRSSQSGSTPIEAGSLFAPKPLPSSGATVFGKIRNYGPFGN